ncbi:DUF2855 family protein [Xenophilus arseniciresistens]|uniref:DUF2855 family protein n=1 Tax=Xenophilus arseniciresistens TaxID=1283306 RepID=A0AAE3T0J2_9BURK|nr:DUF2855 family protein [Xenophilus arseniciresistens]MDA7417665.1 DUF2855 family protein [Xenophilus arseniciresistens]
MSTLECLVRRSALADTRLRSREDTPLADGQVRVGIDHFALTANNVTYANFGDSMGYWQFFPTGEEDWGLVPVWGFGRVLQSTHPGVAVGERLYGFFPMASQVVLQPDRLSPERFADGAAHRAELPAVYNQYLRCALDPLYRPDNEDVQVLLRPLYITSWLIDDFLADNDFFGAAEGGRATVLLSSASSKTAYGTAFQLARRGNVDVIGLTSAANRAFCESLGCYTRVLDYRELQSLGTQTPCVYVDFAGNGELREAIHTRFAELRYSMVIGNTHADERAAAGAARALPGPRATFFFAPAQIKKRTGEWGAEAFAQRLAAAWHGFAAHVTQAGAPWLQVQRHAGGEAAQALWQQLQRGQGDPRAGHVVSMGG